MPSATHVIQMLSFSEQTDDDIGSAHDIEPASDRVKIDESDMTYSSMKRVRSTFLSGYAGFQWGQKPISARAHVEAKHQLQCCIEVVMDFLFLTLSAQHSRSVKGFFTSRVMPPDFFRFSHQGGESMGDWMG